MRPLTYRDVSTTPNRVFAARLAGLPVFDPAGDQVGKVRDLVVGYDAGNLPAIANGFGSLVKPGVGLATST